MKLTFTFIGVV